MYTRLKAEMGEGKRTAVWQIAVEPSFSAGQHTMPTLLTVWTLQHHLSKLSA